MEPSRRADIRSWLRAKGRDDVAKLIDGLTATWAKTGVATRRNWWDVLSGTTKGKPCRVGGVEFPILQEIRKRRDRPIASKSTGEKIADRERLPRPFLKWAGGKRQLISEIESRLPGDRGTYYEPFVGGGALFFHLRPTKAVLADQNERLIRTYSGIKNNVEDVIAILKTYKNNKRFFLKLRKDPIDKRTDAEVAAWFIFLNKTGFNGLYRVNSRNEFNVPFGDNKRAQVCDDDNLRACSMALANTSLEHGDFTKAVSGARAGDLVYFDPPYIPLSATSYFTSYTAAGFHPKDQKRLRDVAVELKERGVFVILSNSSAQAVSDLYSLPDFQCIPVSASRLVNSKASRRGKVTEMLILPLSRHAG